MAVKKKVKNNPDRKPSDLGTISDAILGKAVATQATGQPLEVSQSTIKNWRRCHKLYDYRFVQLIRHRKPILQLIRGTMLGKCFDAFALERMDPKKFPANVDKVLAPYEKEYGKLFAEEKEHYGPIIDEVKRIVTKYKALYANDGLTYPAPPGGSNLGSDPFELPIRVDLAPGIVFTGHIDKMPYDKQGRVWDMDHKSHKKIPDHEDRFRDLQQVFYMWAMPLSGYPKPTGVIWDYVRTKPPTIPEELKAGGLSQRKDIDTTWEVYLGEITRLKLNVRDYKKMQDILKPRGEMDFFQRVQLPTPSKDLINNVVADAQTTAVEIKRLGGVDKTRTIDMTCKRCEYYNLCQTEFRGLDAAFIRKSEYETNPDPRHVHVMDNDD
jgi:hypothetical protein